MQSERKDVRMKPPSKEDELKEERRVRNEVRERHARERVLRLTELLKILDMAKADIVNIRKEGEREEEEIRREREEDNAPGGVPQ